MAYNTSRIQVPTSVRLEIENQAINFIKQIKGETVLHMLESSDIMVSTGSACNSGSKEQEKTLIYTLEDATLAVNTIRISLSTETTFDELNTLITKIKEIGK